MTRLIDLTGVRYGRLLVLARDEASTSREARWLVRCDCGVEKSILGRHMRRGLIRSCGCITKNHGHTSGGVGSPEFQSWSAMIARCTNPNSRAWRRYGGRGITICKKWTDSFADFLADMGPRPSLQYSLDRYPNADGNYEPGNCRWATDQQQGENRSTNRFVNVGGEMVTVSEAARRAGRGVMLVHKRLAAGWTIERALEEPPSRRRFGNTAGETQWNAQLTDELVREARRRAAGGESSPSIASALGANPRTVRDAIQRKTWRHIV